MIRKELLAILKDPRSRIALLGPPIVQCFVFGYAASYDLSNVPYAALDQDHSAASREFLARLDGSGVFERVADLRRVGDIEDYINNRRALLTKNSSGVCSPARLPVIHRIHLEDVGLGPLVAELWPLAVIGSVTLAAASWMFGNRLG